MGRKQNRKKSSKKGIFPTYVVPEMIRSKQKYQHSLMNKQKPYASPKTPERQRKDYMIQKMRPKVTSPKRTKKGLPPVNDLAVAMAREIINCQATKTKFNLQKYLDRSSLPNKQDVHMAKAKAHQLVQKHFKNIPMHFGGELGAKGPKSKYQPPKYDPEDEWMPGTAYPKMKKEDFERLQKIPPKNQNIMPKYWPKLKDDPDFKTNQRNFAEVWRQNPMLLGTQYPESWYPTFAKITENWSPGSGNAKIRRLQFDGSPGDYVGLGSALKQMLEDYDYRMFDPNLPQSQQQNDYGISSGEYKDVVRIFKIIKGMEQFEELPEQTEDNPLRSPSYDPRLDYVGNIGLKARRRKQRRIKDNRKSFRKMQRQLEDDMKKMERADLLDLIQREGDDPNYEFPENFFYEDPTHEEVRARGPTRNQYNRIVKIDGKDVLVPIPFEEEEADPPDPNDPLMLDNYWRWRYGLPYEESSEEFSSIEDSDETDADSDDYESEYESDWESMDEDDN